MLRILRITNPTIEQLREAVALSAEHPKGYQELYCINRLEALKKLEVELVFALEDEKLQGVCFLLPERYVVQSEDRVFFWLFAVYSSPKAKNLGAVMLLKLLTWYPAVMGIGVSEDAAKIYEVLRWKKYTNVWRCVHPIKAKGILGRYQMKDLSRWKKIFIMAVGGIYELIMFLIEIVISPFCQVGNIGPSSVDISDIKLVGSPIEDRIKLVSHYLNTYRIVCGGKSLEAVEITGLARVVRDNLMGWRRLLAHIRLWRELRKNKALLSEYIVTSEREKNRAFLLGYLSIRMPIYFWDKNNQLNDYFENLQSNNFTFASCDKII